MRPGDRAGRRVRRIGARARLAAGALLAAATAGCVAVPPAPPRAPTSLTVETLPAALAASPGAPVVGGNDARLLFNAELFPAMAAAIASARESVLFARYTYGAGPAARVLAETLAERARAGVAVRVLLDAFGSRDFPDEYADLMRRAGCQVLFFRPLHRLATLDHRNHRRILVVDGRIGFTGGTGVGWRWTGDGRTPGHWRSAAIRLRGPAVGQLERAFAENRREATGRPLDVEAVAPVPAAVPGVPVQVIRSSPLAGRFDVYTMFLLAVAAARRTIYLTTPYLLPDDRLTAALAGAVRRGVQVVILGPGPTDWNLVRGLSRGRFGSLLAAGVEIHEYLPAMLHAKTLIADGTWATVGSANVDNRSFALNDELTVGISDRRVAGRLEEALRADLRYARRVDRAAWLARGLDDRLLELIAAPLELLL